LSDSRTRRGGRAAAQLIALLIGSALLASGCAEDVFKKRYEESEIDYYDDLYAVSAVGDDHVWVAGYFGSIYRSTDAGKTWRKLPTDTQKSIYDISFADEKHGWAVGRQGYIIHTTDAGNTWERQFTPREPAQHLFSVHAIDPQRAYIVGEWGGRYLTEDGGRTWQDLSFVISEGHRAFKYLTDFELERFYAGETIYEDTYLNDVYFVDAQRGWMVGEYGLTYYTEDGGKTWEQGQILGDIAIEDFEFDEGSAEIPREKWPVLFEAAEKLNEREYTRIRVEAFLTEAELAANDNETFLADERAEALRDFLEGEGVTQERIRIENPTPFDQESVDMDEFRKSKIGDPVAKVRVLETPFLFDVKFHNEREGLVAGLGGVILYTDDGGRSWRYADTESELAFFGIAQGSRAAVAVGERGMRRMSADGGRTWQRYENGFPDVFTFMRDMVFATGDRGWIVGATGRVFRSSDGGMSWSQVLPPPEDGVLESGAGE
jgi:photosystem II stability/assembly factor-like uncharacterized protein